VGEGIFVCYPPFWRVVILLFAGVNFKRMAVFRGLTQLSPYFFLPGTGRLLPIVKVVTL
jgi:hypothetical protein